MSYGIKIYTKHGFLSVDGVNQNLRLLDSGEETLVASGGSSPTTVDIEITPSAVFPAVVVVCVDSGRNMGYYAHVLGDKDSNNKFHTIRLYNSCLVTVDVYWRAFVYV